MAIFIVAIVILVLYLVEPSISGIIPSKYNITEISQFAKHAGFNDEDLIIAVAIALAESGGNPKAYNPETSANTPDGMGSRGLWQIYAKAHPNFGPDFDRLYDPQTNANAAFSIFTDAGYSFKPWSTYNNEAYLSYVNSIAAEINA